ncbi:DUF5071 domain-containing protein [Paenibacillus aquistagni]|uniref:DUF5071 domain-containing protein n=1 Tax=Paenibacillus aquistagni TaxID=1852522 RepID=UPI000B4FD604|nr:DUF5071 domain-containing protein [Paenibacillus aquistagni]
MKERLPRDKHDFERVRTLYEIERNELIALLPEILTWLQDINWPIAIEVAELLLNKIPRETISIVIEVLKGEDEIWKENCLRYFVMKLPKVLLEIDNLKSEITRIANQPTEEEKIEEIHITAQQIIMINS